MYVHDPPQTTNQSPQQYWCSQCIIFYDGQWYAEIEFCLSCRVANGSCLLLEYCFKMVCLSPSSILQTCWGDHFCLTKLFPPLRLPLINFENCFQDNPSVSSLRMGPLLSDKYGPSALKTVSMQNGVSPCLLDPPSACTCWGILLYATHTLINLEYSGTPHKGHL